MQHKRDFAVSYRMLALVALSVPIGALAVAAAALLLALIHLFTNLFYFQRLSFAAVSPADSHLGLWAIALPWGLNASQWSATRTVSKLWGLSAAAICSRPLSASTKKKMYGNSLCAGESHAETPQ